MKKNDVQIKHIKVRIFNIVLYPVENQFKENYIKLWESIHRDKITVCTFGDRYTRIRTALKSDDSNIIRGDFSNAIFFDPKDSALDKNTNEIIPGETDPNKGLGLKTWDYYFFPEYHRLVVKHDTPETQIIKFLNTSINQYFTTDEFQVNTEKDKQFIERIINSTSLTKLYVRVSYSNNDNLKGWKGLIDEQLRKSRTKTASLDLSATKKNPINVTQSEMITGFVELSASNGYAEAGEVGDNGVIYTIKTAEHPVLKVVDYVDDPGPGLKEMVRKIASDENS